MEEFVIPLQHEDLINSDATDKYTVDRVLNVDRLTDDEITAKIEGRRPENNIIIYSNANAWLQRFQRVWRKKMTNLNARQNQQLQEFMNIKISTPYFH